MTIETSLKLPDTISSLEVYNPLSHPEHFKKLFFSRELRRIHEIIQSLSNVPKEPCGQTPQQMDGTRVDHISSKTNPIGEVFNRNVSPSTEKNEGPISLLHESCARGDLKKVQELINPSNIDSKEGYKITPLMVATVFGHVDIVKFLLEKKANLNRCHCGSGFYPIHLACLYNQPEVLKILLKNGADIEETIKGGNFPLMISSAMNNIEITKILLKNEAEYEQGNCREETPLHRACARGYFEIAKLLLDYKANAEADYKKKTPLRRACAKGHFEIVKLLLKHRANIESRDFFERTPLMVALYKGQFEIAKFLIQSGANIHATYIAGNTPLHIASREGRLDFAKLLIEHNTSIDPKNDSGETPLFEACDKGNLQIVNFLLDNHADIEAKNNCKETPLFIACFRGHLETVKHLLQRGASVEILNSSEKSPLEISCKIGHLDIVEILFEKVKQNLTTETLKNLMDSTYQKNKSSICSYLFRQGLKEGLLVPEDSPLKRAWDARNIDRTIDYIRLGLPLNVIETSTQTALQLFQGNERLMDAFEDRRG